VSDSCIKPGSLIEFDHFCHCCAQSASDSQEMGPWPIFVTKKAFLLNFIHQRIIQKKTASQFPPKY